MKCALCNSFTKEKGTLIFDGICWHHRQDPNDPKHFKYNSDTCQHFTVKINQPEIIRTLPEGMCRRKGSKWNRTKEEDHDE